MTIPKEAWPVVEEIRKSVPKPEDLPTSEVRAFLGWGKFHKCPIGLLPYVFISRPTRFGSICPFSLAQASSFWRWWDIQENAKEAVREVWDKALSE